MNLQNDNSMIQWSDLPALSEPLKIQLMDHFLKNKEFEKVREIGKTVHPGGKSNYDGWNMSVFKMMIESCNAQEFEDWLNDKVKPKLDVRDLDLSECIGMYLKEGSDDQLNLDLGQNEALEKIKLCLKWSTKIDQSLRMLHGIIPDSSSLFGWVMKNKSTELIKEILKTHHRDNFFKEWIKTRVEHGGLITNQWYSSQRREGYEQSHGKVSWELEQNWKWTQRWMDWNLLTQWANEYKDKKEKNQTGGFGRRNEAPIHEQLTMMLSWSPCETIRKEQSWKNVNEAIPEILENYIKNKKKSQHYGYYKQEVKDVSWDWIDFKHTEILRQLYLLQDEALIEQGLRFILKTPPNPTQFTSELETDYSTLMKAVQFGGIQALNAWEHTLKEVYKNSNEIKDTTEIFKAMTRTSTWVWEERSGRGRKKGDLLAYCVSVGALKEGEWLMKKYYPVMKDRKSAQELTKYLRLQNKSGAQETESGWEQLVLNEALTSQETKPANDQQLNLWEAQEIQDEAQPKPKTRRL